MNDRTTVSPSRLLGLLGGIVLPNEEYAVIHKSLAPRPLSPVREENQQAAREVGSMDWLTETPAYGMTLAPQLLGVKILEICASALLLLTLLTFIVGWAWHLSRRVRVLALVPLAAGITAGSLSHVLHDTYVSWVSFLEHLAPTYPPNLTLNNEIASANQAATVLGWVFVIVTGILFVLGLFNVWRSAVSGQGRGIFRCRWLSTPSICTERARAYRPVGNRRVSQTAVPFPAFYDSMAVWGGRFLSIERPAFLTSFTNGRFGFAFRQRVLRRGEAGRACSLHNSGLQTARLSRALADNVCGGSRVQ